MLHALLPDDGEVAGLLALMLLTDARRAARTGPERRADPARRAGPQRCGIGDAIAEGVALVTTTLPRGSVGAYQLQAAIAAVHDEARARRGHRLAADPGALRRAASGCPTTRWSTLNHAIATAMVHGPAAGLARSRRSSRRAARGPPPPRRRARASARAGGRPPSGDRALPDRGRPHDQHSGAKLPPDAGGAAERRR